MGLSNLSEELFWEILSIVATTRLPNKSDELSVEQITAFPHGGEKVVGIPCRFITACPIIVDAIQQPVAQMGLNNGEGSALLFPLTLQVMIVLANLAQSAHFLPFRTRERKILMGGPPPAISTATIDGVIIA
jgi:hypothetical protein